MSCEWLSVKRTAEWLGVSESFVRRMVRRGDVPVLRLPGRGKHGPVRICKEQLLRYQRRQPQLTFMHVQMDGPDGET